MTIHGRRVGLALLLLLVCVGLVVAQEAEPTKVVGSNSAGSLFQAASGEAGAGFTYELTGTQAGISAFCANQAAAVIATRALTVSDVVNCQNNGVSFYEVLFGVDGYALIASPDVTFAECLSVTDLNALVSPSAAGTVSTWAAGNAAFGDVPFSLVTVAAGTRPYDLLDSAVNGDGLRADATFGSAEEVVAQVAAGTGVLGVVPLGVAASAEGVTVLELRSTSAQNVLNLSYTGGERLFAYLNAAQAEALGGAVAAVLSTDGQAALNTAGALSLPDAALAVSQGLIGEGRVGRRPTCSSRWLASLARCAWVARRRVLRCCVPRWLRSRPRTRARP
ncbi:MAG: substrate-binding domain-containing protein [Anaerolineae bacterium]|nr:substrate-binding domain-containing protein [Anaerolineae bacterium]